MTNSKTIDSSAPWKALYTTEPFSSTDVAPNVLTLFNRALAKGAEQPAVHYFDQTLSYSELDQLSSALAAKLEKTGFSEGDRLGLYLQNTPDFLIASLAAWRLGGIAVPFNPMLRSAELGKLLPDCKPSVIVVLNEVLPHLRIALADIEGYDPLILVASATDYQSRDDERVLPKTEKLERQNSELLLQSVLDECKGQSVKERANLSAEDIAFIVYTSGTTGMPKGAMITHKSTCWNAKAMAEWMGLQNAQGPVLGIAPLFHITGIVGGVALAWELAEALVLNYRFHPEVMLEALVERRPGFTVGTITAFNALMSSPKSTRDHYRSIEKVVCGGAPVPPPLAKAFYDHTGVELYNGYGLTETAAGVTTVPAGRETPVDKESGALSVGVPLHSTEIWIEGDHGERLSYGEAGEIVISGPMVSPGYWQRPEATAETMREDGFRSGDIGIMDEQGWVYIVDRKKDMISASGYKVWPREVEDVIYQHPAIHEVAVVGVNDEYRGETVKAVVSLKPGNDLDEEAFVSWCRERMAAYKVPKFVQTMAELPKTPSGKILRRALKDDA
jgi:long-chain acyl-CoA synthetase